MHVTAVMPEAGLKDDGPNPGEVGPGSHPGTKVQEFWFVFAAQGSSESIPTILPETEEDEDLCRQAHLISSHW